MSNSPPKRIGIAIVEHQGCYLVGTRGPESPLAGYAEFPGGKSLPDETPESCAVRECLEETHLPVEVNRLLLRCQFSYPHATVDLHFFQCRPTRLDAVAEQHNGFRWIPRDQLSQLRFPEANTAVLAMLTAQA